MKSSQEPNRYRKYNVFGYWFEIEEENFCQMSEINEKSVVQSIRSMVDTSGDVIATTNVDDTKKWSGSKLPVALSIRLKLHCMQQSAVNESLSSLFVIMSLKKVAVAATTKSITTVIQFNVVEEC